VAFGSLLAGDAAMSRAGCVADLRLPGVTAARMAFDEVLVWRYAVALARAVCGGNLGGNHRIGSFPGWVRSFADATAAKATIYYHSTGSGF
jgi:hypothetical protein